MKTTAPLKILAIATYLAGKSALAVDTVTEEKTCAEIGFKPKTEKFASCVLELYDRRSKNARQTSSPLTESASQKGDGSADDQTCQRYGFQPASSGYAECRMKIDLARQEATRDQARYERELASYNQRVADLKREQDRQRAMRQLELGLRMMGGQPIGEAARSVGTGAPITPPAPPIQNQTIILPGAQPIHCTTVGSITNCR